jgi:hypothetical protein
VVVVLLLGRGETTVPNVRGMPEATAVAMIEAARLEVVVEEVPNPAPIGEALATTPEANTEVERDFEVNLIVSAGQAATPESTPTPTPETPTPTPETPTPTPETPTPSPHSITDVTVSPASPATLENGKDVEATWRYSTSGEGSVRIWVQPLTRGNETPGQAFSTSPLYPEGSGSGSGNFTIQSGNFTVDQIRIQMWTDGSTKLLAEVEIAVNYQFKAAAVTIVGMAIASDDHVYAWYSDGTVSSGTSSDLDAYRSRYSYSLPGNKSADAIVGMDSASDDHVYVWYRDGTVSSGTSSDLDAYRSLYSYSLPGNKSADAIVGMAIASNDWVYVWYSDGTVSVGTSSDLDAHNYFTDPRWSAPDNKSADAIVGMAASSEDRLYVWYKDGTVSSGDAFDLDKFRSLYSYSSPVSESP